MDTSHLSSHAPLACLILLQGPVLVTWHWVLINQGPAWGREVLLGEVRSSPQVCQHRGTLSPRASYI